MLNNNEVLQVNDKKEYLVPDVFFIIMTIKHQLLFADEVEQAVDKNSHICCVLLLRTNSLISEMLENREFIHQSEIHNYLINFRQELPKLAVLFGGSSNLPMEF